MRRPWTMLVIGCAGLAGLAACTRDKPAAGNAGSPEASKETPPAPEIPIDVMPKVVAAPITYPPEARERGEQGLVQVKALVGVDGRVVEAAVAPDQAVPPILANAAVEAVRGWTFEPARRGAEPVAVWIVVPVNFKLK